MARSTPPTPDPTPESLDDVNARAAAAGAAVTTAEARGLDQAPGLADVTTDDVVA